jgi:hypothetical protein
MRLVQTLGGVEKGYDEGIPRKHWFRYGEHGAIIQYNVPCPSCRRGRENKLAIRYEDGLIMCTDCGWDSIQKGRNL